MAPQKPSSELPSSPDAAHPPTTPAAAPEAAAASKEPPPEKPADVRRRTKVVLSFWAVVLFLGLPVWWITTSIYRAPLPVGEMLDWADGKACRPVFPLQIAIEADSLPHQEAQTLVRLTQTALDDLNDFPGHHLRLQLAPPQPQRSDDSNPALTVRLTPGDGTAALLDPHSPVLGITYPAAAASPADLANYIAAELRSTYAEERAIISYLLSKSAGASPETRPKGLSAEAVESLAKRTTRSLRYAPTYHLSFSLFTSGAVPNTWDVEAAIQNYMKPVLDVLSPIHNFTIDSQVQLFATPGAQADVLGKDDLSSFINAAEWPLSPSIGGAPTINFLLFVGNQTVGSESGADTSQSWLIPQWGTVYLQSLPPSVSHVSGADLKQPMLTFAGHLLSLLGTPQTGSLPLRLSTLTRIRSADLLLRASSTLGSLARLSNSLTSISIPRSVADGVSKTMQHLELACSSLGGLDGLEHARIAEAEAERAFFEKSMVGQLYFPDEHKIAVYLPLLGPIGVPLVMGLLNELKAWRKRRQERAAAQAEKKDL
ncbi:phosphatidylinositol-glycan biosynthesis class S protein [Plectosphaerella plurivora]|uniref:Phosphatidylinositol-glycan biosynthesis class S protein n=1 Tax=Plectosphaerella plurivora TaxID=936078 RepID=A0A9P8V324_9PEZI|nr:phosphatidylinositol-glycan biosynthesis class S protein [Plectosphaerella plurivora]